MRISKTYHVGEDFLDIADGMRAIDEAIEYLEMGACSRIGDALAFAPSADIRITSGFDLEYTSGSSQRSFMLHLYFSKYHRM